MSKPQIFTHDERTVKKHDEDFIMSQVGHVLRETYNVTKPNLSQYKNTLVGKFTTEQASDHINRILGEVLR